jgi:hypothetical protein
MLAANLPTQASQLIDAMTIAQNEIVATPIDVEAVGPVLCTRRAIAVSF